MQFMVRVELYDGASRETYDLLHQAMTSQAFNRYLTMEGSGRRFETLTGTYWIESASSGMEILEAARRAASSVYSAFGIMVAGDGRISFLNCPALPTIGSLLAPRTLTQPPIPTGIMSYLSALSHK